MKDTIDLLWTNVQVRVRDPFWGSFMVAWLLVNWKLPLFLFYPMDWDLLSRLNYISEELYSPWYGWGLGKLVLIPLAYTMAHLLVFPRAVNWIDGKYQSVLIERRNRRVVLQGKLLITAEDKKALLKELEHERIQKEKAETALKEAGIQYFTQKNGFEGMIRAMTKEKEELLREINGLRNPHMGPDQVPLPPFDLEKELRTNDDPPLQG